MDKSLLEQELAPLNAEIEQVRGTLAGLEGEMRAVAAELETFSADRLRFDALRDACNALDRLDQLESGQLFWEELPEIKAPAGHMARVRSRIAGFDGEINRILEKQADLRAQGNRRSDELDHLYDEIRNAHARDERRENEFAIERELSPVLHAPGDMPWSFCESDRRYRRTLLTAMFLSLLLGIVIHMVVLPKPVRPVIVKVPERLAMMVRKEHKKPVPVKKAKGEKKEEKKAEKAQTAKAQDPQERPNAAPAEQADAPKKPVNTGVLAFKDTFKDLIDETPVPKLGTEARLVNNANQTGQALASRSLVTMQGGGGGAGNGAFSRNVGSGGIGNAVGRSVGGGGGGNDRLGAGTGFAQVKSAIASTGAKDTKPLGSGARAGRTDEEIQILFDRYKAALYRIYNTELRKDPTLRGKMVLRITIEPSGAVSACAMDSSNMDAADFSTQIVDRVKKFNFGAKDGVPKMTILYPIDFLPAR